MSDVTTRTQTLPSADEVYRFPGDWGLAVDTFGREALMRRMMRHPWLRFADHVMRALVCEGEHRIVPAIGDLPKGADLVQRKEKQVADEEAEFARYWVSRLARPLRRVVWHGMEALPYGHKLCEIEVDVIPDGPFAGRLAPVDIAPKPRTAYTLKTDRANLLEGALPFGTAGDMVPAWSILLFSLGGRDDHPEGTPALESAYEAWYQDGCARPIERKALAVFAGGIKWAEAEKGVPSTTKQVVGGKALEVNSTLVVATEAAKMATGATGALPPGWSLKTVAPATSWAAFKEVFDRCATEMLTAFLLAARALKEAEFGSRADSETADGTNATIRDWLRGEICAIISELFRRFTVANRGEKFAHLAPRYEIQTDERKDIGAVVAAIQAFAAADLLTPELVDHLLSLIGVSEPVRRTVMESLQTSGPSPKETEFADPITEDPPETKPSAKRRADNGTARLVKKHDKALRRVARRWQDGKLSADEFLAKFSDQLAKGHDEAATLGARLAGFSGDRLPVAVREYVAATLATESEFLTDLVDEVEAGTRTPGQARLAARRYAKRMSGTVSAAFHEASPASSQFWWLLGAAEHCADCPRLASKSPFDRDELITRPREGETECRDGCQCRLVRGDGACGPGPVDLGDYE